LDAFDVEIWKDKHCCYTKKLENHAEIESQVFPIVLGQCHPDLKGAIYDVNTSGTDTFTKTNKEVAEYVACAIPGAGEYQTTMINMNLPARTESSCTPNSRCEWCLGCF
jgi:hypothetical protein